MRATQPGYYHKQGIMPGVRSGHYVAGLADDAQKQAFPYLFRRAGQGYGHLILLKPPESKAVALFARKDLLFPTLAW